MMFWPPGRVWEVWEEEERAVIPVDLNRTKLNITLITEIISKIISSNFRINEKYLIMEGIFYFKIRMFLCLHFSSYQTRKTDKRREEKYILYKNLAKETLKHYIASKNQEANRLENCLCCQKKFHNKIW